MAHDVFICHSAKDKTTADAVCAMLESNGVRCWIAPRDVTPGMEWSECIIDAIEECRVMVLVFTTNANESGQIRREIERAVNRGVAILPIRIEDILPARALEYFIGNVHWLDALTPPLESHIQNLAGTVKILLGRLPQHGAPVPLAQQPRTNFPQNDPILQRPEIPLQPPTEPSAPEKSAWTESARPSAQQQTPVDHASETPPRTESKKADPPPAPPITTAVPPKQKHAAGIFVIAFAVFIFSAFTIISTINGDFHVGRTDRMALAALGLAASCGVITKKNWGRALQLIFSAVCILWLLNLAQDAFRQTTDTIFWLCGFGFSVFAIWYMFTPRVKEEFAEAAAARQNQFKSPAAPRNVPLNLHSGLFTQGAGPLPKAVLVIALLSFVEAAIWVFGSWQDLSRGRIRPIDICAILLLVGGVLTGYGLLKLQGWARILKLICSAVDVVIMVAVAQEAFHEGGLGEVMWIAFVIYFVWSAWYLFTSQMRPAFLPKS